MQALKAVVIILGVLILVALAAVAWAVLNLNGSDGDRTAEDAGAAGAVWQLSLGLPAGCEIAATRLDGGRLAVRTAGPAGLAGCGQVHVVDVARGAVVGTVAP